MPHTHTHINNWEAILSTKPLQTELLSSIHSCVHFRILNHIQLFYIMFTFDRCQRLVLILMLLIGTKQNFCMIMPLFDKFKNEPQVTSTFKASNVPCGFPSQRACNVELWCFICCQLEVSPNKLLTKPWSYLWFEKPWHPCCIIVMDSILDGTVECKLWWLSDTF